MVSKRNIIPFIRSHSRTRARSATSIFATLHVPAECEYIDCVVQDISEDGAGLLCASQVPPHTYVTLDIPQFGTLASVSAWFKDGLLGVKFLATLDAGDETVTRLRKWIARQELPAEVLPIRSIVSSFRQENSRVER